MCGRYANHVEKMKGWEDILSDWPEAFWTGFNVAPTQLAPVLTEEGWEQMRWGLIPAWAKDAEAGKLSTFNARLESVHEKPVFRRAWNERQTCIVPALGYYEWKTIDERKQPYFIRAVDEAEPLVFAGLWDRGNDQASFTLLTQESRGQLADLHHRMPVFMEPSQAKEWLKEGGDAELFAPESVVERIDYYPVSLRANSSRNEGADLIEPTELPPQQAGFDF